MCSTETFLIPGPETAECGSAADGREIASVALERKKKTQVHKCKRTHTHKSTGTSGIDFGACVIFGANATLPPIEAPPANNSISGTATLAHNKPRHTAHTTHTYSKNREGATYPVQQWQTPAASVRAVSTPKASPFSPAVCLCVCAQLAPQNLSSAERETKHVQHNHNGRNKNNTSNPLTRTLARHSALLEARWMLTVRHADRTEKINARRARAREFFVYLAFSEFLSAFAIA